MLFSLIKPVGKIDESGHGDTWVVGVLEVDFFLHGICLFWLLFFRPLSRIWHYQEYAEAAPRCQTRLESL